jgi:hypothetical protein
LQKYAVNNRLAQNKYNRGKRGKKQGKSKDVLPAIRNGQTALLVGESAACILVNERLALRRTHSPEYVSIRQHTSQHTSADDSVRQHTSAYVSIRQHTSAYVSIRQHTSAYVSIRQHGGRIPASDLAGMLLAAPRTRRQQ